MKTDTDTTDTAQAVKRGMTAVKRAWKGVKYSQDEFSSRLGDLLADLMHAAQTVGPDAFELALDMARTHFEEERAENTEP